MSDHTVMACDQFDNVAAELALGTLSGQERAAALMHVETCLTCRALLEDLALTSDALLQLAPHADPPVGFESRLFAALSLAGSGPGPRRRRWSRMRSRVFVGAAAAALVLVAGIGIGRLSSGGSEPAQPIAVGGHATAHLMSGHNHRGDVVVSGNPAWLFMTVEDAGSARTVWCEVTLTNGRTLRVGQFDLAAGYGGWAAPLAVTADQLRSAQLVTPDGMTIASATFAA